MSPSLPDLLDPWRAADQRSVFVGRLPLSSLPRLRGMLLDSAGDITFRLVFSRDDEHRAVLRCEVSATLMLRCQRCLEAVDHLVRANTLLALAASMDDERRLPERYDPLLVSGGAMRPRDLIEDELLLALPQIAMHGPDVCDFRVSQGHGSQAPSRAASPFAVLADLKRDS